MSSFVQSFCVAVLPVCLSDTGVATVCLILENIAFFLCVAVEMIVFLVLYLFVIVLTCT